MKNIPALDLTKMYKANAQDWIARNLIEIRHPDMSTPLRFVNAQNAISYGGNTYAPRGFVVAHPMQSRTEASSGDLTIDNADLAIMYFARSYSYLKRAELTLLCVTTETPGASIVGPYEYLIKQIALTEDVAVLTLGYEDVLQEAFPYPTFDERYPGLFGTSAQ